MSFQSLPVFMGLGAVVASIFFLKLVVFRKWRKSAPKLLMDPTIKYQVKLIEKEILSHDTRRFRFVMPSSDHVLGLPIGQHIYLSAKIQDTLVIRPYTPVSSDDDKGYTDLVIKVYFKDVHPKFPEGGKMSQHLNDMEIGDTIDIRGPSGKLIYAGCGVFHIREDKKKPAVIQNAKKVGMIAGGTGITPMLQLIREVFKNPEDNTDLNLLFCNQTEDDILLKQELEDIQKMHPKRFHLWYTVDRPKPEWKYSSGFVSSDMISEHLPPPGPDTMILMCGPPPMINFACQPNLDKLGYSPQMRFAY